MSFTEKHAVKMAEAERKCAITNKWPRLFKRLKKEKGIDQKTFCESLNPPVDPSVISRLKKGGIEPEWDTIERVQTGFDKHFKPPVNKKGKTGKKRITKK